MLGDGLKLAVADLDPVEFLVPETNDRISLWITDASLSKPSVAAGSVGATNSQVLLPWTSIRVLTLSTFLSEGVSNGGQTERWYIQRAGNTENGLLSQWNQPTSVGKGDGLGASDGEEQRLPPGRAQPEGAGQEGGT